MDGKHNDLHAGQLCGLVHYPPESAQAASLTLGLRFSLRWVACMSDSAARTDQPWQIALTTPQIVYQQVTLFDLFMNYQWREYATVNVSLQNLTNRSDKPL